MGLDWERGHWEAEDKIDDEEDEALTVRQLMLLDGVVVCLRYPWLLFDTEDCSVDLSEHDRTKNDFLTYIACPRP